MLWYKPMKQRTTQALAAHRSELWKLLLLPVRAAPGQAWTGEYQHCLDEGLNRQRAAIAGALRHARGKDLAGVWIRTLSRLYGFFFLIWAFQSRRATWRQKISRQRGIRPAIAPATKCTATAGGNRRGPWIDKAPRHAAETSGVGSVGHFVAPSQLPAPVRNLSRSRRGAPPVMITGDLRRLWWPARIGR